jgi:hypothetical protein
MSRSGHSALGVRQESAESTSWVAMTDSGVTSPQPTRVILTPPPWAGRFPYSLLVGALDVFLVRRVDANDVAAIDEYRDLYY